MLHPARCYVLCRFKQPGCQSFNYITQTGECDLNNATIEEFPEDIQEVEGVNYFDMQVSLF